jgi:hypothetical protein
MLAFAGTIILTAAIAREHGYRLTSRAECQPSAIYAIQNSQTVT